MTTLLSTDFKLPYLTERYTGKVRDVYTIADKYLVMVCTDRISAFDRVFPVGIPHKGAVINSIAAEFLQMTSDIIPNWLITTPDPMVSIGLKAKPCPVEFIVRGYLSGHAWRLYKSGKRSICGIPLPDGLKENQKLPTPIITPTTKAKIGHDLDLTREEIIYNSLIDKRELGKLEFYALELFEKGSQYAKNCGLILADTKYEFGKVNDKIILIDEVHTPDSSRYFYIDDYNQNFGKDVPLKQLSKEMFRQWLMTKGFFGDEGQNMPIITPEIAVNISNQYIELYEALTGNRLIIENTANLQKRILSKIESSIKDLIIS
jgi:phosphoribosylaminoimidazole-succinocarboxamide synthase